MLVLLTSLVALTSVGVRPAAADEGLSVSSTYTYAIDPVANVVHVTADMTFVNTKPNRVTGNIINKTYFTGFTLPVPVEAINTAGAQNGAPITVRPEFVADTTTFFVLSIDFTRNLFFQQSAHVIVTYDIIGHEPRNEATTRVNGAYAAFDAFGIGDAGQVTVRVAVPPGYVVDTFGDDAVVTDENGTTVYTSRDIVEPDEFAIFVSARNDEALTTESVTQGSSEFVIRAWPGDDEWKTFVERHITEGVPALESLIGQPWPVSGSVEIREAVTPYLYGYAGWFNPTSRELEMGEDLDPQTIVHELSHAWFNDDWFDGRWLSEGFAQEYAGLANEALGEDAVEPDPVDMSAAGALQLSTWGGVDLAEGADDTETYGYNTSWSVVDALVDEIGIDGMRAVLTAIATQEMTYQGDGPAERDAHPLRDWRRLLDLVEAEGGDGAAELLTTYVLTTAQADQLPERDDARESYDALVAASGEWAAPAGLRDDMSDWFFDDAATFVEQAEQVLAARDDVVATLEPLGMRLDPSIEVSYEHAVYNLDDVSADIAAVGTDADQLVATRDKLDARLAELGTDALPAVDDIAIPDAVDIAAAQSSVERLIEAADRVVAARDTEAADRDFYERVGLYGDDVSSTLDAAIDAIAAGDVVTAEAKATEVEAAIDASDGVGRSRVLRTSLVAAATVMLLVLVVILLVRRGRRRRRRAEASVEPIDTEAGEPDITGPDITEAELAADTL